jgi:hypothetical protein
MASFSMIIASSARCAARQVFHSGQPGNARQWNGCLRQAEAPQQGNNSESARKSAARRENRLENICEFSNLRDDPPQIPCPREQGINSSTTGNRFADNRELIRPQQGIHETGVAFASEADAALIAGLSVIATAGSRGGKIPLGWIAAGRVAD